MNWTQLLKDEIESTYATTEKLIDLVDPATLSWKPATGSNWMTVGQLLRHLAEGCGAPLKGFVTGDWGLPEGMKIEDIPPAEMLPPAEKLPAVATIEEARQLLAKDKALALKMVDLAGEENLANKLTSAPWAPAAVYALGRHALEMVAHLAQHKGQLFYYLKLQGRPVGTANLWGGG